jgi:hypothetical protein
VASVGQDRPARTPRAACRFPRGSVQA